MNFCPFCKLKHKKNKNLKRKNVFLKKLDFLPAMIWEQCETHGMYYECRVLYRFVLGRYIRR